MQAKQGKILLFSGLVLLIAVFFFTGLHEYFSLEILKAQQQAFVDYYQQRPLLTLSIYFLLYVIVTGLSLPGAAVMTLAGGALFGLWIGLLLVSFASSMGATLAFLASRFLFRDYLQHKYAHRLQSINDGLSEDGAFYLFSLRLVPLFPFFVINLLMGLTQLSTWTFYWVSQVGMLAGTFVFVNAGTQLGQITALGDILSLELLLSFTLLGLFPLLARFSLKALKRIRQT